MARIEKGAILESKYNYGWEVELYEFYEVISVSEKGMATLRPLQKHKEYFPTDGHIYYDTPCQVTPLNATREHRNWKTDELEPMPNIRRKIYNFGTEREYIKPEEFYRATVWTGKPKDVWNLH